MSRPSQVIVLCEDRRQQVFVRRFLQRRFPDCTIRNEPLPAGRGSGEQWVRERYARNVDAYRSRAARAETALVVVIDADTEPIQRRIRQLSDSAARNPNEKISHLIPKRNIETWVLCLTEQAVDEETDYRQEPGIDDQITPAARAFFEWSRPNAMPPGHCVDSLRLGIPEIRRLET